MFRADMPHPVDLVKYWERVDEAVQECAGRPGLNLQLISYSRSILLSDLREWLQEAETAKRGERP